MLRTLSFAASLAVTASSSAFAAESPKWQGHTELEGKWGTERSLGEMGVFIPVWQDGDTLLAADIRQRIDDANSQEGNYGLSLRQLLAEQDVILGGYAFFDRRRTPNANVFNQATVGAEVLWPDYEARLNVYIPESTEEQLTAGTSTAAIVGSSIQVQSFSGTSERALPGFDAEVGAKFDLSQEWKLWLYGGGFYFDADGYDTVAGPRGRIELSRGDLPLFGQGSRFTIGLEAQHDNVRGEQAFAIARLRVPFSAFGGKGQADDLTPLEQRMTSRIYRDVDIVSGESAPQLVSTEAATVTLNNGTQVSEITQVDAGDDLVTSLNSAGVNSLVVVDGSAGTVNIGSEAILQTGQTLIGGGVTLTATTAGGATYNVTLPGSKPTIHGTNAGADVIAPATDSTIQNVNVTGGFRGIVADNDDNVLIEDVSVDGTDHNGIQISFGSTNAVLRDVTITDAGFRGLDINGGGSSATAENVTIIGAADVGLYVGSTLTFSDGVVRDSGSSGIDVPNGANLTLNGTTIENAGGHGIYINSIISTAVSGSGNVMTGTVGGMACWNGGVISGSIAFDDILGGGAGTCP